MSDCQPWHFDEEIDTPKSFRGFSLYLESQSIDKAYNLYAGHKTSTKQAPGHFKKWASFGKWAARKEAYLQHIQSLAGKQATDTAIKKHAEDLEQFRSAARSLSRQQIRAMKGIQDLMDSLLFDGDRLKSLENIEFSKIERASQIIARLSAMGSFDVWAKSLQVEAIQKQLDGLKVTNETSDEPKHGNCQH